MAQFLPPLRLVGAEVLRDGEMQMRSVVIDGGRISRGPFPEVDLSGYLVLPGIVDLDAPQPQAAPATCKTPAPGWVQLDRTAAAYGVTTAIARQDWSWSLRTDAPPDAARALKDLARLRSALGTDLRAQLHVEIHMMDWADALIKHADGDTVRHVIFSNRLVKELALAKAHDHGASPIGTETRSGHLARLHALSKRSGEVPRFLCGLAETFDRKGVLYGSLGDPDGETREFYSMIGARLCLHPYARSAATLARAVGDPVLLSAAALLQPDIALSAFAIADMVATEKSTALVSGGSFGSLSGAAFHLADSGRLSLPEAWSLISSRPAAIARMPDRGVIDYGQRADLVIVQARSRRIEATIANGRLIFLAGDAAHRFMGTPAAFGHAAE